MTDSSDKAKWDALAEMLGAKISQSETPPAPPRKEVPSPPRQHADMPPPPRKRADWDALAGELGVPAESKAEAAASPPATKEPPSAAREAARPPQRSADAPAPQPDREERPRRPREERPARPVAAEAATDVSSDVSSEVSISPPDDERSSPWVSLEPAETDEPEAERDEALSAKFAEDMESKPEGEGSRRPRRRRRRSQRPRGEDRPEEAAVGDAADEEVIQPGTSERLEKRDRPDRRDANLDTDEGEKRTSHKRIPSWSEAISIMIDANLASRSSRRKSTSGGGRVRGRRGGGRRG